MGAAEATGSEVARTANAVNSTDLMRISGILGAAQRKVWEIIPSPTILYISTNPRLRGFVITGGGSSVG